MPRRTPTPFHGDYSPAEVALILRRGRATVYLWIKKGELATVTNEFGDLRIEAAELERMKALLEALPPGPHDQLLQQARRRAIARANGHLHASRFTKEEIAEPMAAGRRRAYENQVDPEHTLRYSDPADFERRVEQAEKHHMERMRVAGIEARMRRS